MTITATTTPHRGGSVGSSESLGSIGWTERTGGVLTSRECLTLARQLLRDELGLPAGLMAMALPRARGRRATIEPLPPAPTERWRGQGKVLSCNA